MISMTQLKVFSHYEPRFRRARIWSNIELRKIAPYFTGDLINVSGWADEDKAGDTYQNYFVNATTYIVSNKEGGSQSGKKLYLPDSIAIDLDKPLSDEHVQAYDCVFNHTVLEHVFNTFQAVENLCKMSRDVIISVVPFIQVIHTSPPDYLDYWRFTPYCLEKLFNQHGFKTIYASGSNLPGTSLYYVWVVSKNPNNWAKVFGGSHNISELPNGDFVYKTLAERINSFLRFIFRRLKL